VKQLDSRHCFSFTQHTQARFPFKRKRLRWQAANHGCHSFDRAFLLAGACVCCGFRLRNARNASDTSLDLRLIALTPQTTCLNQLYRLHLPPALPQICSPHVLLQISFPAVLWRVQAAMFIAVCLATQRCLCVQASSSFSVLAGLLRAPHQFVSITFY